MSNPKAVRAAPPASERCRKIRREIAICSSVRTTVERLTPQYHSVRESQPDQVQLDFLVAALLRPEVQRRARDLVDDRDGQAQPCEVDGLQVVPAGLARIDAQMGERV